MDIATVQSLVQARRLLNELAKEGNYAISKVLEDWVEYSKTEDGRVLTLTIEVKGPRQYAIVKRESVGAA
jgi:hypothetical protein